jgi:nitrogen regulatory protein PII
MKAIFIIFNQANTERIEDILDNLNIRGYTWFETVKGRGSDTGEPRMGTHTWPEMNSATIAIVQDDKVKDILDNVRRIDEINKEVGIRAFVWDIVQSY